MAVTPPPLRALAAVSVIVGLFAIACEGRQGTGDSVPGSPNEEARSSASEPPSEGRDIGLGFRVCRVVEVDGLDLGGGTTESTAWTATDVRPDGRCSHSQASSYFVAIDLDGDGSADASSKPMRHCFACRPVAAPDMDGDGNGELLVLEQGGSVSSYSFYDVATRNDRVVVVPIQVKPPGHRRAGHVPGKPLRFWVGGDEGYSAAATCTGYPGDPVLVVTWSNHPIEGPGSEVTEVHRTSFRLRKGAFRVVDATDGQEATDDYRANGLEQSRDVCGVDLSRSG